MLRERDTRSNFRTPEAREAFAYYLSLFADGFAPRALSTEVQDPVAAFAQGFFAIWPSSATTVFDFMRRQREIPGASWGTARVAGPNGPGPTSALDISLCVSAASRRPADAWARIRHVASSANELRFQRLIGVLPARVEAWAAPQLATPVLAPFAADPRYHRDAADPRVGAHPDRSTARRRADGTRPRRSGGRTRRDRRACRPYPRQATRAGAGGADYSVYALADWRNLRFVGLGNFADLLATPMFWRALGNTALFAVFGVPMAIGAALFAALLLNDRTVRRKPLWRVALFAPYVTSVVATAIVWRFVLGTRLGLLNRALTGLGLPAVDWLGDPHAAIFAILLFVTWKIFGCNMLVFTAALSAVPPELMEAARLDGASRAARFRHVTLPAIGPTLLLSAVLSVAGFLQLFAEPYVMTLGGPAQSTTTVLYFMFDEGFKWWNLGQASAVALILFVLILGVTMVQARIGRRYEWL